MIKFPNIAENRVNIPTIRVYNKYLGELVTKHRCDPYRPQWITTELKNRLNKTCGYEVLSLNSDNKRGTGATIEVDREYRQKNHKFGEILRLSSIMGIMENGISEFEIHSKNSAIYFHSKYKFKPAITNFEERNSALLSIIRNSKKEGYEELREEAEEILEIAYRDTSSETQRRLCKETNSLAKRYIQKVLETKDEYKNHPFDNGMRMILRRREIVENKDFFNNLYAKHRIDYKI